MLDCHFAALGKFICRQLVGRVLSRDAGLPASAGLCAALGHCSMVEGKMPLVHISPDTSPDLARCMHAQIHTGAARGVLWREGGAIRRRRLCHGLHRCGSDHMPEIPEILWIMT